MKNYIKVAFADKDDVKKIGARWDNDVKSWYIPDDLDKNLFKKWPSHDPANKPAESISTGTRIYLNVPFADKDAVKTAGGRWDGDKKQWYYLTDKDAAPFKAWIDGSPEVQNKPKAPPKNPNDDLASDLDDILNLE